MRMEICAHSEIQTGVTNSSDKHWLYSCQSPILKLPDLLLRIPLSTSRTVLCRLTLSIKRNP